MNKAKKAFEEFWNDSETQYPESLKDFAKEIFIAGFNQGSHKPIYSMNKSQFQVLEKIIRGENTK